MRRTMISCLAVWAVVVSQTSWAVPIPGNNIVVIGGQEWAEVDLFSNNSWDTINAQCPAGVCSTGSVVNGWSLEGWKWASLDDVQLLFNVFTGLSTTAPGVVEERASSWAPQFIATFRPTTVRPEVSVVSGWAFAALPPPAFELSAPTPNLKDVTIPPNGVDFASTASYVGRDSTSEERGAWFYRDRATQAPAPHTLSLFGLGMASLWMSRRKKQAAAAVTKVAYG